MFPGSYCDTCPITVTVGVQDGPRITFRYKVVPKPNPCANVSSRARAAAPDCTTKTLAEPAPGSTAKLSSPIGRGGSKLGVTVRSSGGSLPKTTIVGEAERTGASATGEAVAACWLIGPDALEVPPTSKLKAILATEKFRQQFTGSSADNQLRQCIALVKLIAQGRLDRGRSAASTCQARRVAMALKLRRGRIVGVRPAKSQRVPSSAVGYKCAVGTDGAVRVTVDGPRRGGLRKKLGPKLNLGVARAADAPGRGTLTFGFSAP